jgi:hypothetical protein
LQDVLVYVDSRPHASDAITSLHLMQGIDFHSGCGRVRVRRNSGTSRAKHRSERGT